MNLNSVNIKEILKKNTMIFALILVTVFFAIQTNGGLLSPDNINNLFAQNGYVVILAVGMLLCILTGGNIDLSVGSIVCFVGALGGELIVNRGMNIWLSMLVCLAAGFGIGVWQAFWIAYVRIPPFIVTLAGMLLWRGLALVFMRGVTISPLPDNYKNLFNSYLPNKNAALIIGIVFSIILIIVTFGNHIMKKKKGYEQKGLAGEIIKVTGISAAVIAITYQLSKCKGFPTILVILCVIVAAYAYFTSKTVPGRYFYAVGGNEKAAKLSGVNTNRVYFIAYVNMAVLSAVAALVCIARFNSAAPTAGTNYELDAIGACFIGGASAYGGIGTVSGVVIGAIFMGILNNGMSIMGIDANWQKAVKGLVLLAAVAFDVISKRKSS